jgi:hypothetical protein
VQSQPTDLSMDGNTDRDDFLLFMSSFSLPCNLCPEDFNHDGIVDNADFLVLLTDFNKSCITVPVIVNN